MIGTEDIYVQTQNSYVCTYRRTDGRRVSCTGALNYGQPMAVVNGAVYIADNVQVGSALALQVGKLDAASGRIEWLWQLPTITNGYGDVDIHGNVVVGLGARGVSAFRLSDGQPLWHALDGKEIDGPLTITTLP
jgi:outer membrane protein assembly factor BamB